MKFLTLFKLIFKPLDKTIFFRRKKITCKSCKTTEPGGSWIDLVNQVRHFYKKGVQFDFGTIYYCPNCNQPWYLDHNDTTLSYVHDSSRIEEWMKLSNNLTDEQKNMFFEIGATPLDFYEYGKDFIDLPCKVTLINEQTLDFVLIRLQKDPPFIYSEPCYNEYITIDKVVKIEPSEYTLNPELRLQTCQAREIRMCFSPTRVIGSNGVQYLLNGVTNFFYQDNIKGSELKNVLKSDAKYELNRRPTDEGQAFQK